MSKIALAFLLLMIFGLKLTLATVSSESFESTKEKIAVSGITTYNCAHCKNRMNDALCTTLCRMGRLIPFGTCVECRCVCDKDGR